MHEMGIVQSLLEILESQAEQHGAERIVRINLEFGVLTGVMPDAIRFAFDVLAKETVAEGAEINIVIVPMKCSCAQCGKEFVLEEYQPFCPTCQDSPLHIIEGRDEMRITSMEIEDNLDESP